MNADMAQWVACSPVTDVAGSNPSPAQAFLFVFLCEKLRCHWRRALGAQ
jgi:hypothetical protein